MHIRISRITELCIITVIAVMNTIQTCWAAPPAPPVIAPPQTPVGGTEILIATAVAMAGYGIWKSRK